MQQLASCTYETMLALIDALDAHADRAAPGHADLRSEGRRPLRTACELCFFSGDTPSIERSDGVVRNLAFCGLSVLAALPGLQRSGRPVEVLVTLPDGTHTHMAGTIAFCRDVARKHFELGIEVQAAGATSILVRDPAAARTVYDWFAAALNVPE